MQVERFNRWAFFGEMCIHGNPSGVDNAVACPGKAVVFQCHDYTKPPSVIPLWNFPELPLSLLDTRQPYSTAAEVAKVGKLKETHPEIIAAILNASDKVSESAANLINSDIFDEDEEEGPKQIGQLMSINHGLLVLLGVSRPS